MEASDPNLNIYIRQERSRQYMEEMKICLKKPDDVKEFVRAARKCEFDVDLHKAV